MYERELYDLNLMHKVACFSNSNSKSLLWYIGQEDGTSQYYVWPAMTCHYIGIQY